MEIRDILHGAIAVKAHELPVVDSRYFQRLRHIKQLGFSELAYPSASHNRYIHSLGAMETATQIFKAIFNPFLIQKSPETYQKFLATIRLASMLHDVGHGPFSHTTEFAMPALSALKLPIVDGNPDRRATHEDYTLKIILDSPLTPILEKAGRAYGIQPFHIAALIQSSIPIHDGFFQETLEGQSIDFRPILQQLISSELDADRMDYLRRDSIYAGVSYGQFDFGWIAANLGAHINNGRCYLSLDHRALYTFEDFLLSRYHMFLMVYFHYKGIIYDEMLAQYFHTQSPDEPRYALPTQIEEYTQYDDAHLYSHLARSKNPWARRIIEKRPYRMLMELHSGIPVAQNPEERQRMLSDLTRKLQASDIHFIQSTSTGELSKYFGSQADPIYVRYDDHYHPAKHLPLQECTHLFQVHAVNRSITRIYVAPEDYERSFLTRSEDSSRNSWEATSPGNISS